MEYALLQPPYRTFLNHNKTNDAVITNQQQQQPPLIIIYNLPTSLTEYLSEASQEESNYIRSAICRSASSSSSSSTTSSSSSLGKQKKKDTDKKNVVVITFDSKTSSFLLGGDGTTTGSGGSTAEETETYLASCVFLASSSHHHQQQQQQHPSAATLSALSILDQLAVSHLTQPDLHTVVLLGNGGREHALAVALSKSPLVKQIICLPGNGGTHSEEKGGGDGGKICNATTDMMLSSSQGNAAAAPLTSMDNATVLQLVKAVQANMVVVGPEQPLVDGVVDALAQHCPNVKVFGPTMAGAKLEASKVRNRK